MGPRFLFRDDENVLELDTSDSCATLKILKTAELH